MVVSDLARHLALVAAAEHQKFSGIHETDQRLKARIYETYLLDLARADPNDDLGWEMDRDISKWAWSATFVSWCVLEAGASVDEFNFSIRHAVFIRAAIMNADAGHGIFQARQIDNYAPRIGDIICNNRNGGRIAYDQARNLDSYNAHSAIVVDFTESGGKSYAITIGGNEGDSVRRTEVELTRGGFVRQRSSDPYICVIANDKSSTDALVRGPVAVAAPGLTLSRALRGHGTFIYDAVATTADYGTATNVASAMTRAGMIHAWVRVNGRQPFSVPQKRATEALIVALQAAGISVAGWGWAQGEDAKAEARAAIKEVSAYGLTDYVADIEPGHNNSVWSPSEIEAFCDQVRTGLVGSFAVSSFALIDWHEPHLLRAALPFVDAVAPQIYWFNFPNRRMIEQFQPPGGGAYKRGDPGSYADLCLDRWSKLCGTSPKPLILTGQAYWGEGDMTQAQAEGKLLDFLGSWEGFSRIAGLNWWHFGGGEGMSHSMLETIVAADLMKKF